MYHVSWACAGGDDVMNSLVAVVMCELLRHSDALYLLSDAALAGFEKTLYSFGPAVRLHGRIEPSVPRPGRKPI